MHSASDEDFEMFFRTEYPHILRTAYILTGDRGLSEDVAQEAFARLYANWRKVSAYERPGAWVRRVALNLSISHKRRRLREPSDQRTQVHDAADPDLHRAILTLSRGQRAAIVLHYFEDLPVAEVAEILSCSPNTVKVHLHRARLKLGAALSEEVPDVD